MEAAEQEAIRRVLAGDREHYRVLMERHLPAVLRMTLRVTGNPADAEEAAQEAFLLAYNKLPGFREHAAFGTWVYRIAMNCSLNLVKRRARSLEWNAPSVDDHPGASAHPSPEATLLDADAQRERQRAMDLLTPTERTAFVLRHLEEQPVDVIARALNLSTNAARQTIFRAVAKLRRELAPTRPAERRTLPRPQLIKQP